MDKEKKNFLLETNVQSLTITTYTQYQNKLLMKLIASAQQDIKEAITQQRYEGSPQALFTAEELASGLRHRSIPLAALEPRKGHYQRAKLSLQEMTKKKIWIPFYKKKGCMDFYAADRLFSIDFEIKKSRSYVNFYFSIATLKYYLSTAMGYHRLDLDILFNFKHNSTRQMYRLYYGRFALGFTTIRRGGLTNLLSIEGKNRSFKSLKAELLEPARKEMKEAFNNKQCDFCFDYTVARIQDSDNPLMQKLIFTCYTERDEELSPSRATELAEHQAKLWFNLKNYWNVEEKVAKGLSSRVKIWMLDELDDLMEQKRWFVENKARKINPRFNIGGYIVKSLDNFLTEKEKGHRP